MERADVNNTEAEATEPLLDNKGAEGNTRAAKDNSVVNEVKLCW